MIIVTKNSFIQADKINHISLDETQEVVTLNRRDVLIKLHTINVHYIPAGQSGNNNNSMNARDIHQCSITFRENVNAHVAFKDMVHQIREQSPDALFLDGILAGLLNQDDIKNYSDEDSDCKAKCEEAHDSYTKPVRRTRKAKRRSKKVLPKAKRSNRSRKS